MSNLSDYQPYLDFIDQDKNKLESTLISWCNINTHNSNKEGISTLAKHIKNWIKPLNALVIKNTIKNSTIIHIQKRPNAKKQVLLNIHFDTVFEKDSPFQRAKRTEKDILVGPGTCDAKGGLLIALKSLEVLEKFHNKKNLGWELILTSDEEIGSPYSKPLLEKRAKHHDLGLIFEPCLPNGNLISERKGSTTFTITSQGKSAHAGRHLNKGINAIEPLTHLLSQLSLFKTKYNLNINIGTISGGNASNIVPDLATCTINLRFTTIKEHKDTLNFLQNVIHALTKSQKATLKLKESSFRPPKPFDEPTKTIFKAIKKVGKELGIPINWEASGGVSDGNIVAAQGLPTIDTLGPRGDGIHTHKEYINLSSLIEKTKLTSLFLLKLAERKESI